MASQRKRPHNWLPIELLSASRPSSYSSKNPALLLGTREATVIGFGRRVVNPKHYGGLLDANAPFLEIHFDFIGRRTHSVREIVHIAAQLERMLPHAKNSGWNAIVGTTTNPVLISRVQRDFGAKVVPVPLRDRISVKTALIKEALNGRYPFRYLLKPVRRVVIKL